MKQSRVKAEQYNPAALPNPTVAPLPLSTVGRARDEPENDPERMMAAILGREKPRRQRRAGEDPVAASERIQVSDGESGSCGQNRMEQALGPPPNARTPRLSSRCFWSVEEEEEMMEDGEMEVLPARRRGVVSNNASHRHWPWSGSRARDTSLLVGLVLVLLHTVEGKSINYALFIPTLFGVKMSRDALFLRM